ncbi:sugar phosphate isomerase/epimerase [Candidatus Bipolaricaulota bacterium]|nr:sugar phosphate isomerase/epimerase [Candidatus Bipolaricaulota bacterium]
MSVLAAARGITSIGLGVELWRYRGEGDPGISDVEELRKVCAEAPFVSLHASSEHWNWDPEGLMDEISLAGALGARTLVLHKESLGLLTPSSRPDIPAIRRLAAAARAVGVMIALENGRDSMWALDLILDSLGDDPRETNLGICIDVGHANISQDAGRQPIINYLERYRGQLIHLHLHDNRNERDDHLPPGAGAIDWRMVLDTLARIDYSGPGVLEIHSGGDLIRVLQRAVDFLRG